MSDLLSIVLFSIRLYDKGDVGLAKALLFRVVEQSGGPIAVGEDLLLINLKLLITIIRNMIDADPKLDIVLETIRRNYRLLSVEVSDRPIVTPLSPEPDTPTNPEELTLAPVAPVDVQIDMGVVLNIDRYLAGHGMPATHQSKAYGLFKTTHVFTTETARNNCVVSNQINVRTIRSKNGASGSVQYSIKYFHCKYRKSETKRVTGKNVGRVPEECCHAVFVEYMYPSGVYQWFQSEIPVDGCAFPPDHQHAPGLPPHGVSEELKAVILDIVKNKFKPSKNVYKELASIFSAKGQRMVYSEAQIFKAAQKGAVVTVPVATGEDLETVVLKRAAKVQLFEDELILKSIYLSMGDDGHHMIFSTKKWIRNYVVAQCLYIDGTHFDLGTGGKAVLLGLVTRTENGQLAPIALATAPSESVSAIRAFLESTIKVLAPQAGVEIPKQGHFYVLPRLKFFMADGIVGIESMIDDLFGPSVMRIMCLFHVFRSIDRFSTANGTPETRGYAHRLLKTLVRTQTPDEFCFEWNMHVEVLRSQFEDMVPELAAAYRKLIGYIESNLIKPAETQSWCRAFSETLGIPLRAIRGTLSEAFNHQVKSFLPEVESMLHLQFAIVERVMPQVHASCRRLESKDCEIPKEHLHQAQLLSSLIKKIHPDVKLRRDSFRFAYHEESGLWWDLPKNPPADHGAHQGKRSTAPCYCVYRLRRVQTADPRLLRDQL